MSRLYKRVVSVTAARPTAGKFFGVEPNATVVRDLRVAFEVVKTRTSDPNTCEVTISNLAEHTRAEFARKPLYVQLDAGYDGHAQRLFAGDLHWGASQRDGATWSTRLALGDGLRALSFANVSRSFRGGVSAYDGVRECAAALGLPLRVSPAVQAALRAQYAGGLAMHGRARDNLDRLLDPVGAEWSIQDGRLQVLLASEVRSEQAFVVSEQTGLVGSPSTAAPTDKGGKPVTTLRTLLYPAINPGARIKVQSQAVSGILKVRRVSHSGDTHGEDWTTEIEAVPL